jgi:hypothetical protein
VSFPKDDNQLHAALSEAFAPPPAADFDAWQRRHPEAVACLNPQRVNTLSQRKKRMQRIILLAATTAAAICVWLGIGVVQTTVDGPGATAFAGAFGQIADQIENAQTITWKSTDYSHATRRDGKTTWLDTITSLHAYRDPGLFRNVERNYYFGGDRLYTSVFVEDRVRGTSIWLFPEKKQATIMERPPRSVRRGGPFHQFQKILKEGNLQWLGKRTLPSGDVMNVFRHTERDEENKCYRSNDFWIDAKTKRLVKINFKCPAEELYDPKKDAIRNTPPGKDASSWKLMDCVWHDIVFDAKVDDTLFSLKPPEGYTVKHENLALRITEQDMLNYLGVFVEFHEGAFPDEAFPAYNNLDKVNVALAKPVRKRSAIDIKYLAMDDHYHQFGLGSPFDFFHVSHDVVENSFRYVGKGVKLGDKDAIVCWYKLKDAKNPNTYRVVYGDLSVKDVAAEDLPLPVGP